MSKQYFENNEELTFKFEAVLTKHFKDLGYEWKAYAYGFDYETAGGGIRCGSEQLKTVL